MIENSKLKDELIAANKEINELKRELATVRKKNKDLDISLCAYQSVYGKKSTARTRRY